MLPLKDSDLLPPPAAAAAVSSVPRAFVTDVMCEARLKGSSMKQPGKLQGVGDNFSVWLVVQLGAGQMAMLLWLNW
jgi:hypothetical protein